MLVIISPLTQKQIQNEIRLISFNPKHTLQKRGWASLKGLS